MNILAIAWLAVAWPLPAAATQEDTRPLPAMPSAPPSSTPPSPLPARERAERPALARLEEAIAEIEARFQAQTTRRNALLAEWERLGREREAMREHAGAMRRQASALLPELWTLSVQVRGGMDAAVSPWDEPDRRFTWLAATLGQARQELEAARLAQNVLDQNQARQAQLRAEIDSQARALATTRCALLVAKLSFLKEHQAFSRDTPAGPEQLRRILDILIGLDFPVPAGTQPLEAMKGALPWPVKGRLVAAPAAPDPADATAVFSLGLAVDKAAPVKAVAPGILAYSDGLPDLGQVAIVAHGNNMFSIYTHLSRSSQALGQEVATGETIGAPGEYPAAHGSGLSFELRFLQKPLNTGEWVTAWQ